MPQRNWEYVEAPIRPYHRQSDRSIHGVSTKSLPSGLVSARIASRIPNCPRPPTLKSEALYRLGQLHEGQRNPIQICGSSSRRTTGSIARTRFIHLSEASPNVPGILSTCSRTSICMIHPGWDFFHARTAAGLRAGERPMQGIHVLWHRPHAGENKLLDAIRGELRGLRAFSSRDRAVPLRQAAWHQKTSRWLCEPKLAKVQRGKAGEQANSFDSGSRGSA